VPAARRAPGHDHDILNPEPGLNTAFHLVGLPARPFADLFDLSDDELRARNAQRVIADASPGYPCRVSLCDAEPGETLLLLPHVHQPGPSPYNASGPIFVRRGAVQAVLATAELPTYVTTRLMSVRAYDARHLMVDAAVCAGPDTGELLSGLFARQDVAYIHLHNAKRGCFSCAAVRD
jgi:hypothetical protein